MGVDEEERREEKELTKPSKSEMNEGCTMDRVASRRPLKMDLYASWL